MPQIAPKTHIKMDEKELHENINESVVSEIFFDSNVFNFENVEKNASPWKLLESPW